MQASFGLVPNFFRTGSVAPGLIDDLWDFAKSAYIANPLPSLFKERLFVYLSRFCQVRYCIVRHVGFLIGQGRPSGDAAAPTHSIEDVIKLLRRPTDPDDEELQAAWQRLESLSLDEFPEPGTQAEEDIFFAANLLFLEPLRAGQARKALIAAIGAERFEFLLALLAFIQTAHYWTVTHPDLVFEEDMNQLLREQEVLADCLLNDPEADRCHLSARLFEELAQLRQEKDDRKALREALAAEAEARREQQVLIDELNHRVKNTLAVVQSIVAQTLGGAGISTSVRDAVDGRLQVFARAHDLLTENNWDGADLEDVVRQATAVFAGSKQDARLVFTGPQVKLTPKQAVAFSMVTTELATNAIKFGALSNAVGSVEVSWDVKERDSGKSIEFCWRELDGPPVEAPSKKGFGTRLIESGISHDLEGRSSVDFEPAGLVCCLTTPVDEGQSAL